MPSESLASLHSRPIGVFDSGVGGLSVHREIRHLLPQENIIYVADSAYAPYGDKATDIVDERVRVISDYLVAQKAKLLVVACNTATAISVEKLRARLTIPVVAVEPAIKPAVMQTRSRVVGVLATQQTATSARLSSLISRYAADIQVIVKGCSGLVERIETGDFGSPELTKLLHQYIDPIIDRGADTLVLGCTHYPLIRAEIQAIAGANVTIIDPASAVARQVCERLGEQLMPGHHRGADFCVTTSDDAQVREAMKLLGPGELAHTVSI